MKETKYTYRHIARVVLEAETPIAIGTGTSDLLTDAPVVRDINGLPYIPGTSLAGVLRHDLNIADDEKSIFGHHDSKGGEGSRLIVTDAVMIGREGTALDGLQVNLNMADNFYKYFVDLPIRQHVRINDKGTAENGGKFDKQIVIKGTRFVFEMELCSDTDDEPTFLQALRQLQTDTFRVGSGTRNGLGKVKVVRLHRAVLNLNAPADLEAYRTKSSNLAEPLPDCFREEQVDIVAHDDSWVKYTLRLSPDDFFRFSSGMGDDEADDTPVTEAVVTWKDGKPTITTQQTLIPATSVKGALAHRTAYHYNKIRQFYVGNPEAKTGDANAAVVQIFGKTDEPTRGNILLSDVFAPKADTKLLPHVKIDRFTCGTIKGALFNEKVTSARGQEYNLEIFVSRKALDDDAVRKAFEYSLQDICDGLLPLGGGVNRGNGIFTGKLETSWKQ